MSNTKYKKRRQNPARLQAERKNVKTSRWDPTGRALLYGDLVFLAASMLLERFGLITNVAVGLCTVLGVILLLIALWLLFGKKKDGGTLGKGSGL